MTPNRKLRRGLVWVMAGAATFGVGLGAAGLASAATNDSTTTTITSQSTTDQSTTDQSTTDQGTTLAPPTNDGTRPDPATMPNGPGETVLTGDTAAKVTAAAEAAEPGATVIRVETDSSGHAYEAHVQLADGSYTTLYFDESFAADGSDTGFGPGPAGQHGPRDGQAPQGQPPAAPTDSSNTTTNG